jgi:hypothetical protein
MSSIFLVYFFGNAPICASTVLECSCCRIHLYVTAPVQLVYEIKSIVSCVYEQDSCGGGVTTFSFQRGLFVQTGDDCALCCLHCFQGKNMRIFHWRKSKHSIRLFQNINSSNNSIFGLSIVFCVIVIRPDTRGGYAKLFLKMQTANPQILGLIPLLQIF